MRQRQGSPSVHTHQQQSHGGSRPALSHRPGQRRGPGDGESAEDSAVGHTATHTPWYERPGEQSGANPGRGNSDHDSALGISGQRTERREDAASDRVEDRGRGAKKSCLHAISSTGRVPRR